MQTVLALVQVRVKFSCFLFFRHVFVADVLSFVFAMFLVRNGRILSVHTCTKQLASGYSSKFMYVVLCTQESVYALYLIEVCLILKSSFIAAYHMTVIILCVYQKNRN